MSAQEAKDLAAKLHGTTHHTGGNHWVVIVPMMDEMILVLTHDGSAIYQNRREYADGVEPIYEVWKD